MSARKQGLAIGTEVFPGVVFQGASIHEDPQEQEHYWRLAFTVDNATLITSIDVSGRDSYWSAHAKTADGRIYTSAYGKRCPREAVEEVLAGTPVEMQWSWE